MSHSWRPFSLRSSRFHDFFATFPIDWALFLSTTVFLPPISNRSIVDVNFLNAVFSALNIESLRSSVAILAKVGRHSRPRRDGFFPLAFYSVRWHFPKDWRDTGRARARAANPSLDAYAGKDRETFATRRCRDKRPTGSRLIAAWNVVDSAENRKPCQRTW